MKKEKRYSESELLAITVVTKLVSLISTPEKTLILRHINSTIVSKADDEIRFSFRFRARYRVVESWASIGIVLRKSVEIGWYIVEGQQDFAIGVCDSEKIYTPKVTFGKAEGLVLHDTNGDLQKLRKDILFGG